MSQEIKNVLNSFAYDKVVNIMKSGTYITPEILDTWESDLHGAMKENGQKIGKARIRELVVCYIISEFGLDAFGLYATKKKPEITDSYIRKMKNQRKKGFRDLKIIKAGNER
ncbi:hypothetical protein AVV36_gp072 [Pectobacterium bacteriophage PM2]|uniref:Phage protein n=1 Tax=Pectobacterium bacteriophage PM2 TaxID=1429794 RepID=A0A0A0PZF8_9CAUD|nr:hypothetical protein AVV36_gp072 [Pectobacterium bacteriophage PM2]AHY25034.1 hypothetical protein PM2_072 [Pectobacterium bacteriophage PM2]